MLNLYMLYFYFLITYGVCKKRKYCNHMSEKARTCSVTRVRNEVPFVA